MTTRATLVDVRIQQAENNIRRNTASFAVNYPSEDDSSFMASYTLEPGDSVEITAISDPPAVLIVRTSVPLTVVINRTSPAEDVSTTIEKLLIWDSDYEDIVLTCPADSAEAAKITVNQG